MFSWKMLKKCFYDTVFFFILKRSLQAIFSCFKTLLGRAGFKENALIYIIALIKIYDLLLIFLQIITILAYISTHLLFCTYLLISNRRKKIETWKKVDNIFAFCVKSNTFVSMEMTSNCSARYKLTFFVSFYFLSKWFWSYNFLKIRKN